MHDYRYLARAVLIPFQFDASDVKLRALPDIIENAPAAFPELLKVVVFIEVFVIVGHLHGYKLQIGHAVESVDEQDIYCLRKKVIRRTGIQDSRLATQYALTNYCAKRYVFNCCSC